MSIAQPLAVIGMAMAPLSVATGTSEEPPHVALLGAQIEVNRLISCNFENRERKGVQREFARRYGGRMAAIQHRVADEFGAKAAQRRGLILTFCRTFHRQSDFDRAYRDAMREFVFELHRWETRYAIDPKKRIP